MSLRSLLFGGVLIGLATMSTSSYAASVELGADRDNTLYEDVAGGLSNGSGERFFAGQTSGGATRRGLIRFDIAGTVPAGATISSATLNLNMSKTVAGTESVTIHRVTVDWGEGSSDASGSEGGGTAATTSDATWIHTFFSSAFWSSAGGDFNGVASATTSVGAVGSYSWIGLTADAQDMLDDDASNFGWILLGNESASQTAKRFDSRENATAANRPVLTVVYDEATNPVPMMSQWGMVVLTVSLLGLAGLGMRDSRDRQVVKRWPL